MGLFGKTKDNFRRGMNRSSVFSQLAFLFGAQEEGRRAYRPLPRFMITPKPKSGTQEQPAKGKRSKRRRSARMRAAGLVHINGSGWCKASDFAPVTSDINQEQTRSILEAQEI